MYARLRPQTRRQLKAHCIAKGYKPDSDGLTGDFQRVVRDRGADFGEFEKRMKEYETDDAFRDKMKGYTDHYITGTREIFKVN